LQSGAREPRFLLTVASFKDPSSAEFKVKVKGKVTLGLTKHHAMKMYWGVDV